ncbi:CAP domain-containing protein [Hydrogenimonas urashimensis]|uniref:CAP domain-containing protein n=1 Tax=Hydrogenimonas urashimensis TaxID=2740515 RepID=UPI0019151668|nr:CAP domain-containing protein [Hydrogenimonas urashimensis]
MRERPTVLILISMFLAGCLEASGLDYLNRLRTDAGLFPLRQERHLDAAAQNHSDYMKRNNLSGHYEQKGDSGFTGVYPWDRTLHAGYESRLVGENVSAGHVTIEESIDSLFSAIYHRFGFLALTMDEIGIGSNGVFYTYDMGNHSLNLLCQNASFEGYGAYYTGVCRDENKKIGEEDYLSALESLKEKVPRVVIWPAADAQDIPPVFYEEDPDPLPKHSVTGYPVSIEFNDKKFSETPKLTHFSLQNESGAAMETLVLMSSNNDPNHEFSGYQFALFPKKRLEWGSIYYADVIYSAVGSDFEKRWCFSTRSLAKRAERFYRIENADAPTLDVVSGKAYAIYVVPKDTNDKLGSVSYHYTAQTSFDYIDSNTFLVTLKGTPGETAQLSFSNGQKITLVIAQDDTAVAPTSATCPVSDTSLNDDTSPSTDEESVSAPSSTDGKGEATSPSESEEKPNGVGSSENTQKGETPQIVISRQERKEGDFLPLDSPRLTIQDSTYTITAETTRENSFEYSVRLTQSTTTVHIDPKRAELKIDYSNVGRLILPALSGTEIIVRPDGTLSMVMEGAVLPKTALPAGTQLNIEGDSIKMVVPLPDRLEF